MASSRVQRWGLKLAAYNYCLRYRPGGEHGNADAMSRLPLRETTSEEETPGEEVLVMELLDSSPVTARKIRRETKRDPVLSRVRTWVSQGWPTTFEYIRKESWYKDVHNLTYAGGQNCQCKMIAFFGETELWFHRDIEKP